MRIWRAGDLLLPLRATSSCHRCRSRAGWRDRQVLSGCKGNLITPLSRIKANILLKTKQSQLETALAELRVTLATGDRKTILDLPNSLTRVN